jgi:hypothetical protein
MNSKGDLTVRIYRLEEALGPQRNACDCLIEIDKHTTPEEIEVITAERAARGTKAFLLLPSIRHGSA